MIVVESANGDNTSIMSQDIPPQFSPPPIPAHPVYQALPYQSPDSEARPGILTTLGVIGVILGALGIFINGIFGMGTYFVSTVSQRVQIMQANMTLPTAAIPGQVVSGDGFEPDQRKIIIDALNNARPLTPVRQKQLDDLLADQGRKLITLSDQSLTPDRLATFISDVKEMPNPDGPPVDVFILGSGRLEISDQTAVFFPNGGMDAVRAGDNGPSAVAANVSPGGTALTQEQIDAAMGQIRQMTNQDLTATQKQTLEAALQYPSQSLFVSANDTTAIAGEISDAKYGTDGTLRVSTDIMKFAITSSGLGTMAPLQTTNLASPAFSAAVNPYMVFAFINGCLAVYLLICGILMLRNLPSARTLNLVYAIIKIVVGLLWFVIYLATVIPSASTGTSNSAMLFIVLPILGMVFPIVLLIALRTHAVRQYYAPVVAG
jgi:hypothetical protein